jgi:hypothetical protein
MTLSAEEFAKRVAEMRAEEEASDRVFWYLSFAGPEGWRGAVVVPAKGMLGALELCNTLGVNPHGQVIGHAISPQVAAAFPDSKLGVLLTAKDCAEIFGEMKTLTELDS